MKIVENVKKTGLKELSNLIVLLLSIGGFAAPTTHAGQPELIQRESAE